MDNIVDCEFSGVDNEGVMKKKKYLWEKKTDRELQLWPSTSSEHYLAAPTLPEHLVRKRERARISAPEPLPFSILGRHGIANSAVTNHGGNYYQSRGGEDFHVVVFTTAGEAKVRIDKKYYPMRRNSVFVAPADSYYEFDAHGKWNNFWFHIDATKDWNSLLGERPFVKKCNHLRELKYAVDMYLKNVYRSNRSLRLLEIYAELIDCYLKAEFSLNYMAKRPLDVEIETFFANLGSRLSENWTVESAANELGISKKTLDGYCRKVYLKSFTKRLLEMRMAQARTLVGEGIYSSDEIAHAIGFSDKHSFSKAFKAFHGKSPKHFI